MDEKIRSVLENEELLAKIAAAVRGTDAPTQEYAPPPQRAEALPVIQSAGRSGSDALALLSALKPFLRQERREKLDALTKALSVASVYKSVKNI